MFLRRRFYFLESSLLSSIHISGLLRTQIRIPYPYRLPQTRINRFSIGSRVMSTNNADLTLQSIFDVKGKVALVTGGGNFTPPSTSR